MKNFPLLLAEPNSVLRQTVALTAGAIQIGPISQASTLRMAQKMVRDRSFEAVIVPLCWDEETDTAAMLEFIGELRAGSTACNPAVPVFVTARACSLDEAKSLVQLNVQRMLIKPFKARVLIEALAELSLAVGGSSTLHPIRSALLQA